MLENRHVASRSRVVKRSLNTKNIKSKPESFETKDWLEDLEGYRTILHRILQGKGVACGCF